MGDIAGFSAADLRLAQATLQERYGRRVALEEVATEVRLTPADRELTTCPALFWKEEGCSFVVAKTGGNSFRSMYFWSVKDRFATGREEYDNLGDCLVTTLKMQEETGRLRDRESGAEGPRAS